MTSPAVAFTETFPITLVFLGTGTSTGVPMLGADYEALDLRDPRDWRTRTSAYLVSPHWGFLIDTTPDFWHQAHREKIRRVDAVLYTHAHADHILGFDDLRAFCQRNGASMPLYGSAECLAQIERFFYYAFNGTRTSVGYVHAAPHVVEAPFDLGGLHWTPLPVPHGKMTTYGYLVEHEGRKLLAYISDAHEVPASEREKIRGCEVLVIDGLQEKKHPTHLSIAEAIEVARNVEAGQTYLTHLTGHRTHRDREAELPANPKVSLAYDGLRVELLR